MYALIRHRIVGNLGDVKASAALAGVAFLLTVLVPWIRYPFLPPGRGNDDTVLKRAFWELILIVSTIVAFVVIELVVLEAQGACLRQHPVGAGDRGPDRGDRRHHVRLPEFGDPYPAGISAPMIWSLRVRSLVNTALLGRRRNLRRLDGARPATTSALDDSSLAVERNAFSTAAN